ncbi:hypothetical protein K502DRAFT_123651 [Neoconidiobolus thromboides FSU 785]|nr:hypothetical protein K502DRAFT_123651 [Neoconidiobolus thromboides FSU 785]
MANSSDLRLKTFIRRGRLLSRSLDLLCNMFIVTTVSIMLVFYNMYKDATFTFIDANDNTQVQNLFPSTLNLTPSYVLLGVACVSCLFSCLVMLSYLRSNKLAGKISTTSLIVEIIGAIVFSALCFYGSSVFQIPKSRQLARHDLWAATCMPLRNPPAQLQPMPKFIYDIIYPMCSAGDWSVICGFISGALQGLLAIILLTSSVRLYLRFKAKRRESQMWERQALNF